MLQNVTPLRKSAPWPRNSSDEHVSCTAPATENASLQILFKCPTPAIVCGNATKPSRFAHFWQGAQSLAPATQSDASTCKSGAYMWCFVDFWFGNVLRATTACTLWTSQLPKVVRTWGALCILTSKCAFGHNGAHSFNISTSKSAPELRFFAHFDLELEMCFAPQRRATLHLSSDHMAPPGWKNKAFRDFPTFSHLDLLSSETFSFWSSFFFSSFLWLFPSLIFICECCRKFDF